MRWERTSQSQGVAAKKSIPYMVHVEPEATTRWGAAAEPAASCPHVEVTHRLGCSLTTTSPWALHCGVICGMVTDNETKQTLEQSCGTPAGKEGAWHLPTARGVRRHICLKTKLQEYLPIYNQKCFVRKDQILNFSAQKRLNHFLRLSQSKKLALGGEGGRGIVHSAPQNRAFSLTNVKVFCSQASGVWVNGPPPLPLFIYIEMFIHQNWKHISETEMLTKDSFRIRRCAYFCQNYC